MIKSDTTMNDHRRLFNCKYPIIEAGMNIGSQLELALAVAEAGAFPSLSISPHRQNDTLDFSPMYDGLKEFIKANGSSDVIVPFGVHYLLCKDFFTISKELKISHWDLFPRAGNKENARKVCCSELINDSSIYAGLKTLRHYSHVLGRVHNIISDPKIKVFSGLELKSREGGGGRGTMSGVEFFQQQINSLDHNLIPFGGIGSPEQVKHYIKNGAVAVGVGTLFAACIESPVSIEAKQKIVDSSSKDISYLPEIGLNALVFGKDIINHPPRDPTDLNRTEDLRSGIYGNATQGLIYVGESIDYVDRIRTVKETVEYLTSYLD